MSKATYYCVTCDTHVPTVTAARKHAREAGPVWSPSRQTFVTHALVIQR